MDVALGKPWLIYGANGYTGQLIAELAVQRGQTPILAGRSAARIRPLAEKLGLEWRAADLSDAKALAAILDGISAVIHCAGPFVNTAEPMIQACLATKTHYLDITGEIPVFERIYARHDEARDRGICLMPGVGFDVVPTDCLAVYVAAQVKDPWSLDIAISTDGKPSPGTTKTMLDGVLRGGLVRRGGALVPYRFGKGVREVQFPDHRRLAMPIPWGDLASAYRSTGIPNITVFNALPRKTIRTMSGLRPILPVVMPALRSVMAIPTIKDWVDHRIGERVHGPDEATRLASSCFMWAEASNRKGERAQAWLETCEGYQFTALSALACLDRLMISPQIGALTPAQAFGADFVLGIVGSRRYDTLPAGHD